MGQYHIPVNLTKREYINPHQLGDGLKALEQAFNEGVGSTTSALHVLLMGAYEKRGGGDYNSGINYRYDPAAGNSVREVSELKDVAEMVIGRWGGDNIVIAGDYAQPGDIKHEFPIEHAFSLCTEDPSYIEKALAEDEEDELSDLRRQYAIGLFTNITPLVRAYFNGAHGVTYEGTGWVKRGEAQYG